jgi:hypothetical protein
MCDIYTSQRPSIFIRDKPILSSERILGYDYDRKGSVAEKITLIMSLKRLGTSHKVTLTLTVGHLEQWVRCETVTIH